MIYGVHILLDMGTSFKAPQGKQHIGIAFQHTDSAKERNIRYF